MRTGLSDLRANTTALPDCSSIEALLKRMQDRDRQAAALFVTRYESRIRRRIRGKLNPAMRRLFDSQEIVSTLGRRLDLYVESGRLAASTEGELWSLVVRMATNAIVDKSRAFKRLQHVESADSELARSLLRRLESSEGRQDDDPDQVLQWAHECLGDRIDRQILQLWLSGQTHVMIAQTVNLSHVAVRKRWQNIRSTLQSRLAHR